MAIAFDAGSSGYTDYAGSITVSHTVSAGSDRFLVVGVLDPSTSDKVSGITYNGVSLTRVRIETLGRGYLYVLTNPDSGTHNIVVTFATADQAGVVCAASFTGVNQTTPYSANAGSSNQYGNSPYSNSITCGTGEVAVDFFGCQDTAVATAGGSQTQIIQSNTSRTGAMSYLLNATAMSWTWASGQRNLAHSVLALSPASGDTTAPTLTSPGTSSVGSTTVTGDVTTDEANGTLYCLVTANATETAATVKATGTTQTITTTGAKSINITGLTASTLYYAHFVHTDAAANDSTVSNSASFTTAAAASTYAPNINKPRSGMGVNFYGAR